jgi:hopanoid biosynthesis associated protein HpnK
VNGLIVTADDFGAAIEVNEAVEVAHRAGILTAASLMVTGRSAADAVARAHRTASLRVGLHLVLVDGHPASPPSAVPDLVGPDGQFRNDMAMVGAEIFLRPKVRRQLALEIGAQFEAFRATGLPLDHVNAHKHFHLHPTISALIVEIGRRFGMRAARVPAEPRGALALAEPGVTSQFDYFLLPWLAILRSRFDRAGLLVPQSVFGLAWSGAMNARRLAALLRHLPLGLNEIYLHPATSDRFDGAVSGYRHAEEFAALTAPEVIEAARETRARLGGYADFDMARAAA